MISILWVLWALLGLIQVSRPAFAHGAADAEPCLIHVLEATNQENPAKPAELKNLSWLAANPEVREQFEKLKEIWGGQYPPEIVEAIEHAKSRINTVVWQFTSRASLARHFERHGPDMGIQTAEAYEEAAIHFGNRQSGSAFVLYRGSDELIKYDPVTQEFLAATTGGRVFSYFVNKKGAVYGLNYALCQFQRSVPKRMDCVLAAKARTLPSK